MTENLKSIASQLIEKYIDILEENGEPDEAYKYLAIDTFQQNWNIEAEDFHQMLRASFSKASNLFYPISWGFIKKSAQNFPEETREMFRNLYDESVEVSQRIKTFQAESKKLLPKVRQASNNTKINTQQDERTIALYLAFRFPEKYMLYKADYYKYFCEQLNINPKKTGEGFLHLQELVNQIIKEGLLDDENFINTYRKFYQKPNWDDKYLIIQNVLYVLFRYFKDFNLVELLKKFDRKELEEYYGFLDEIIENFGLQENDQRLVFNSTDKILVFTIGQRYILYVKQAKSTDYQFRVISEEPISDDFINFDGKPDAYLNRIKNFKQIKSNSVSVLNAIEKELNRTQISGYSKFNKKELEKMAFDIDFRNEILNQLDTNRSNKELTIWKESLEYAYKQIHINHWNENEKPQKYAIEYNGILYPNKYIFRNCITYIENTYPDFEIIIPTTVNNGQRLNDFLKSKGANAIIIKDYHPDIMKNNTSQRHIPLNQILFGAPGTGKTYNTKKMAIEIINGEKERTREEINREYEELVSAKQIVFTTFHQSLGYENFIEGIKPETSDGNVTYEVKDGIFKQLVNQAKQIHTVNRTDINWDEVNFYKMSLGGKNNPLEHQYCVTNNLGGINWGGNNDLTSLSNIKDWKKYRDTFTQKFPNVVEENRYNIQASFILNKMKDGDIVIATKGNHIIDSIGKVIGGYHYEEDNPTSLVHFRKIDWFLTDLNTSPDRFLKKQISQQSIYKFDNADVKMEAFKELTSTSEKTNDKGFVLIIDEINRGNVSAIFGELITLLEEDKRKGNKEQTEVTLPYSNDKFSVPNNVYIIGTMNTADRSVEALDTALRRRFSFIEMQPNPDILSNSEYQDVDLKQLLETINQRIEVLIDKDHQIGHSYFIGIENLNDLKLVFKDKIIPLLEEYFYGDFGKTGLVLGGSFIEQEKNKAQFPKNFTYENDFLEDKKVYRFTPFESWNESTFISVYED